MNDSKNEEVMIPDWMFSQEAYTPSKDKEAFLSKSTKSVLSVLAKLQIFCHSFSEIVLYDFVYYSYGMFEKLSFYPDYVCRSNSQACFFFGSIYPTDFKRDSRCRPAFCIYSSSICLYGKSTDFDEYYIQSVCISNIDWYFVSWNYME